MNARRRDESLEALEERVEKRRAREEDDEEVALEELIEALVPVERVRLPSVPEALSGDEFTCSVCQLIRSRRCLADEEQMICVDCAAQERREPEPAVQRPTVEAPCPACGTPVMVPEREDAACGFFCPECGVHVMWGGGHLHFVWNHRYRPDHLAGHLPAEPPEEVPRR